MRRINLQTIRTMAREARLELQAKAESVGRNVRIFLHWSAGHYGQPFHDYHINIDASGELYTDVLDLSETLSHTWRQNTGAIGIAFLCAYNATTNDLGPEPPTVAQIETAAQVVAMLCEELGIPVSIDHVRTHAEQADMDGYGPATTCERWDLWFLSNDDRTPGGEVIRGKAIWYQQNGVGV